MHFELTQALIDEIVFAMENQRDRFMLDTEKILLIPKKWYAHYGQDAAPDRYIELPAWNSADGFRLMERFVLHFKNPALGLSLQAALQQGRGVFRAFKDILNRHPVAEKRWLAFKKQEMQAEIIRWYHAAGQEDQRRRIGNEPEETGDLIQEDFIFRKPSPADAVTAQALHKRLRAEYAGNEAVLLTMPETLPEDLRLIAETAEGELAGYIGVTRRRGSLRINALAVKPEFRGLGIGEELCARLLQDLSPAESAAVTFDLPATAGGFSHVLARLGFAVLATRYYTKIPSPNAENVQNHYDKKYVQPKPGNKQEPRNDF
ncbi:MAG: GNAT family N-acetyltransferase [Spirochaetaceae bacterium]|jgi:ribosomal protein S18 acetylase RimI-like enzyme|nr:GNAT family N-acetyltransferase [Spirochaetaceae bacterium]